MHAYYIKNILLFIKINKRGCPSKKYFGENRFYSIKNDITLINSRNDW